MISNPKASVIINNYNYEQFLQQAIDSALNQHYANIEVIVVDDGSTDNSRELISSYNDKVISVLKENRGQASALNAGFNVSQGEIIIFLDADDYLFPDAVERVASVWKPGLAKVHYRLQIIDASCNQVGFRPASGTHLESGNVLPTLLRTGCYSTTPTSGHAFSRTVLTQILPIPEEEYRISADGYLITIAPFYGAIGAIEEPLGAYRQHGNNLWAKSRETVEVKSLQRIVKHDFQKYELLTAKAIEMGYLKPKNLGFNDHFHLRHRIASLRLDPQNHPVSSDTSFALACRGVGAILLDPTFKWTKKLVLSAWFIGVGWLPLSLVEPTITWLLAPDSRPNLKNKTLDSNTTTEIQL